MSVEIRRIFPTHAGELAALHAESFGGESWSAAQIEGSLALETTQGWAAFEGSKPLGFIMCQMLPEAEILTLCVTPARRRQKTGAALARVAIDAARAKKCEKMFLEVATDNISARKLYERLNFKPIGARRGYYKRGGESADAIMLALAL